MNILIVGHDTFENKGCQALIFSTTRILKDTFPSAKFKVFSWDPDYDTSRFNKHGIQCEFVRHNFNTNEFSRRNRFWLFLNSILKIHTERILYAPQYFYNALNWADLVVVSGGDILADYGEAAVKHYFFPVAVGMALGKPVYVFAQSISRYNDSKLQRFCKKYLDRVSLITVREQLSFQYMKELNVKAPVHLTADPAFTLQPSSAERVSEIVEQEGIFADAKPLVGFSVSHTITRWGGAENQPFVKAIAAAIDRLTENYPDARFVFVPHVTYRNDRSNDDRIAGQAILEEILRKDRVCLVEGDYDCEESKGLIGLCDVFVGARTHATIASASQVIPTIALAYSAKAYGIMEAVLDRKRCVLDVKDLTADRLVAMVDYLLKEKVHVVTLMEERLQKIRTDSLRNGDLAKELFS